MVYIKIFHRVCHRKGVKKQVKQSVPVTRGRKRKIPGAYWPQGFLMAAGEGFEPSHTESESAVLPLHNPAVF